MVTTYKQVKKWRLKNKDKVREQGRRYRSKHPETSQKAMLKYRSLHLDEIRECDKVRQRERRHNNPEKQRLRNLAFKERQEAKRVVIAGRPRPEICELCGEINENSTFEKYKTLFDHDHISGKFRGWICDRCNKVLGLVDDNPELLIMMADYLKEGGRKL